MFKGMNIFRSICLGSKTCCNKFRSINCFLKISVCYTNVLARILMLFTKCVLLLLYEIRFCFWVAVTFLRNVMNACSVCIPVKVTINVLGKPN